MIFEKYKKKSKIFKSGRPKFEKKSLFLVYFFVFPKWFWAEINTLFWMKKFSNLDFFFENFENPGGWCIFRTGITFCFFRLGTSGFLLLIVHNKFYKKHEKTHWDPNSGLAGTAWNMCPKASKATKIWKFAVWYIFRKVITFLCLKSGLSGFLLLDSP